ncbi:MAG: hypothetical protein KJ645_07070 [Planctomycetes bacterium]|nr:hypothetical protein [Planctomycetota bacterium]
MLARSLAYHRSKVEPENYVIVVIGGSVAGLFVQNGNIPFENLIKDDARFHNRSIKWFSWARGGFKQPQQVCQLAFLFSAGITPDAVINIDGFNEVALGNFNATNRVYPLYPSMSHWGLISSISASDPGLLGHLLKIKAIQEEAKRIGVLSRKFRFYYSGILGNLTLMKLRSLREEYGEAVESYVQRLKDPPAGDKKTALQGPFKEIDLDDWMGEIVHSWSEASISLQAMCEARGIHYLHVLQPTLHDEGAKPVTEEERKTCTINLPCLEGVRTGYPRLRTAGEDLRRKGIHFYDLSMIFRDVHETIYYDSCHFHKQGSTIFGQAVAEAFLDSLR